MSAAMLGRLAKLERTAPTDGPRPALILVHCLGRDPADLIGVTGLDVRRLPGELVQQFLGRLEAHIRATRGKHIPLVAFAIYRDDVAE